MRIHSSESASSGRPKRPAGRSIAVGALDVEGAGVQVEARLLPLELAEEDADALVASGRRDVAELVRVDDPADGLHGAAPRG